MLPHVRLRLEAPDGDEQSCHAPRRDQGEDQPPLVVCGTKQPLVATMTVELWLPA